MVVAAETEDDCFVKCGPRQVVGVTDSDTGDEGRPKSSSSPIRRTKVEDDGSMPSLILGEKQGSPQTQCREVGGDQPPITDPRSPTRSLTDAAKITGLRFRKFCNVRKTSDTIGT